MKPGKKDTITKLKNKKQIRLLNDSLKGLHAKYCNEFPAYMCSYATFCRQRPFWVVPPKLTDRDTCLCKKHENVLLIIERLAALKVLSTEENSLEKKIQAVCCEDDYKCYFGECCLCKVKKLKTNVFDEKQTTHWFQWQPKTRIIEPKTADGETKEIKIMQKEKFEGPVKDLIKRFEEVLPDICQHIFNIKHQFKMSKILKEKVADDPAHALIHIDFSENWVSKFANEIQAVHFGGSHVQITLHTGVMYI
ncbi:hypothetical protein SNE40_020442 [Patella caerulea]|uniref:Uncharacterized protein n=1 Tax=Patella caerulea TaxID=87958 RepID=A0AAN8GE56_PATCE